MKERMTVVDSLPADAERALMVGRVFDPSVGGPTFVRVERDAVFDLSPIAPTAS